MGLILILKGCSCLKYPIIIFFIDQLDFLIVALCLITCVCCIQYLVIIRVFFILFFWPLHCQPFFHLRFLITPVLHRGVGWSLLVWHTVTESLDRSLRMFYGPHHSLLNLRNIYFTDDHKYFMLTLVTFVTFFSR